jgi:hypothetical protein
MTPRGLINFAYLDEISRSGVSIAADTVVDVPRRASPACGNAPDATIGPDPCKFACNQGFLHSH